MENDVTGLEYLQKLKNRVDANDKKSIKTDFSDMEISFIRKLSPARYPEEPYDLYKWRQKLQKKLSKYVRMIPNQYGIEGKILPRRKENK